MKIYIKSIWLLICSLVFLAGLFSVIDAKSARAQADIFRLTAGSGAEDAQGLEREAYGRMEKAASVDDKRLTDNFAAPPHCANVSGGETAVSSRTTVNNSKGKCAQGDIDSESIRLLESLLK